MESHAQIKRHPKTLQKSSWVYQFVSNCGSTECEGGSHGHPMVQNQDVEDGIVCSGVITS